MIQINRVVGAGLSIACLTLTGVGMLSMPVKAEETVLIAQQSELEEADALYQEGIRLFEEGSTDSLRQAIDIWNQALPLLVKASAQESEAVTLNNIGYVYDSLGDQEQALEYYNQALPLMRALSDLSGEATTLNSIAGIYSSLGDQEQALEYYNQALPLLSAIGDRAQEASALNIIAGIYSLLGEKEQALEYLNQALPLMRAIGDRAREAVTLSNIGHVYDSLGEKEQALEYYNQALPLSREAENLAIEATILSGIGNVYSSLGEQEQALAYQNQALPLSREVEDLAREAAILNNIGGVYHDVGEKEQALAYYNQALSLGREVEDLAVEATTLNNIGSVYDSLGEKEQALAYYNQVLLLRRALSDLGGEATTLNNIGHVYFSLGEQEQALAHHNQVLPLRRAVRDRGGEATTLNNIGAVYSSLGEQEQALAYYNQALPLSRAVGDRASEANTLSNLSFLYQEQGELSDALTTINNAIALIEDLRLAISPGELRATYFSTVQDYYQLKLNIQMQMGQPEAAFETSEASRSRLLIELLSESNVHIRQGVAPELLDQEQSLQRELVQIEQQNIALRSGDYTPEQAATLDSKSDSTLQQLDQVIAQIRRTSPAYADIIQPQPLTLAQIQQEVLDSDTVLLQYALGEDQSYLWIVGQDHFKAYTLPAAANIQSAAAQFQSVVSTQGNPSDEAKRKGDQLVSLILPEIPEWLAGKRLLIAGDGMLSELPFTALPLPNQSAYVPLLAKHEVLTQPSITAISVLRQQLGNRQPLPPSLAVLADPIYRADDDRLTNANSKEDADTAILSPTERNLRDLDLRAIERLPYTRTEADNILQLAAQNNLQNIHAFDSDADTDWMSSPQLSDYSLVHLATHGFINPVNPQLSGLVLALVNEDGQLRENGFLRLHDIFNLKLAAELVVLSACQTGNGEAVSGEGIVGLSRGFMYAGAERVAVSLWNVNDQATAELMSEFYRYLLEDSLTPAAAMRAAQLDAWKAGQTPYLWAAFTLQGEWQP